MNEVLLVECVYCLVAKLIEIGLGIAPPIPSLIRTYRFIPSGHELRFPFLSIF
jgi:hypothetical protein